MTLSIYRLLPASLITLMLVLAESQATAQFLAPPQIVPVRGRTDVQAKVLATDGQPFGVGRIEIPLRNPVLGDGPGPLAVRSIDGVIAYPVSADVQVATRTPPSQRPVPRIGRGQFLNRVGNLIRELTDNDKAAYQTVARRVTFLIPMDAANGAEPIQVEVTDRAGSLGFYPVQITSDANLHAPMLGQWWADYTRSAQTQIEAADYPPLVEIYLVTMLSRQLQQPLPDWIGDIAQNETPLEQINPLLETLRWMSGGRELSDSVFTKSAAGVTATGVSSDIRAIESQLPLPASPDWEDSLATTPASEIKDDDSDVVNIEPLASSVPPECFYLRYGSFANFLWFQDLSAEFGGDLSAMVTLSGVSNDGAKRLEKQLGIKMTAMSRLLGPTLIEDQALIGRDLFLQDGASMGVVMRSTNAFLLRSSLMADRQAIAAADDSVTLGDIELSHGTASLLRSTDNAIRSYLVQNQQTFCITNSETIANRFLEIHQTGDSLAKTIGFRHARQQRPIDEDDTIFVYLSPEMMRGLLSPSYLIELRRRMQAKADITLVRMARLAAQKASSDLHSIDSLIQADYLPADFGIRADGSGVVAFGDSLVDTARGSSGTFLPIADQSIDLVSFEEAQWYEQIADAYERQFARLDPIFVGVARESVAADESNGESWERLRVHAEISPWQADQYGWWAQQLGPPTEVAMQFAPDDIVAASAHVVSDPLGPPTHLFAAIKDSNPPSPESFDGLIGGYRGLKQLSGYLGAWPLPGALDRLPLGLGRGQPVGPGMSRLLGGVYRFTGGGFSILSFQPEVMTASIPHLAATQAATSAQARGKIDNLRGSQLEGWVNQQLHQRAAVASRAGADFLNSLQSQLDVSIDAAPAAARDLLGGEIRCPLGGRYQVVENPSHWESTAWIDGSTPVPSDYQAPVLTWFRGAEAEITQLDRSLVVKAVINVARLNVSK